MKPSSEPFLHIVAFDVPYPPDYGGVIDIFYKIKALHKLGVKIILHCYDYGRGRPDELNKFCSKIFYYPRKTGWKSQLSLHPYIVTSRANQKLLENLTADPYPVLFEGLHTTSYLNHHALAGKIKIYRESNIEHEYYLHLAKAANHPLKKAFFITEAIRLKLYEPKLKHAKVMLVVSQADKAYLERKFPQNKVIYLPSFHGNEKVHIKEGFGKYALFHGNLSVPENESAVTFLIEKVFSELEYPLIVAGKNPSPGLARLIDKIPNVNLIANPAQATMEKLIHEAHLHVLYTFQPTGLKLKLLNTLFQGRHCLVNKYMLAGTSLHSLCHIADTPENFRSAVFELAKIPFSREDIQKRESFFDLEYNDARNAKMLLDLLLSKN